MQKIKDYLFNKKAYTLYAIALSVGAIYGFMKSPFYLHLLDGMTIMSLIYLLIGIFKWGEKGRYLPLFYREKDSQRDLKAKNAYIAPALFIMLVAFIASFLY